MSATEPETAYLFDIAPSVAKLHVTSTYLWRPGHPLPLQFASLEEAVTYAVDAGWTLAPVPDDQTRSQDFPHDWFQLTDARWAKVLALEKKLKKR